MTITLRSTKGTALTYSELDGNFTDLNNRVNTKLNSASVSTFGLSLINDNTAEDARNTLGIDISKIVNGASELTINSDGSLQPMYQQANERTGSGEAFIFSKSDGGQKIIGTQNGTEEFPTVERLVISGGDGYGTGEGGDIYLWAGRTDRNNAAGGAGGGDIKIDAGAGYGAAGGTVKIRGGDVYFIGEPAVAAGGFIEITAGSSYNGDGANIALTAGNAYNAGNDGEILLSTGKGTHNWKFDRDGNIIFPDDTIQTTAYTGTVTTGFALSAGNDNSSYNAFNVVTRDNAGYIYYCGNTSGITINNSPTVIKMDPTGRIVVWQTTINYEGVVTAAYAFDNTLAIVFSSSGSPNRTWNVVIDTADGSAIASSYYDQGTDDLSIRDLILGVSVGSPQYAAYVGVLNAGVDNGLFSIDSGADSDTFVLAEDGGGLGSVHYHGVDGNPATGDIYMVGHSDTYGSIVTYYTIDGGIQWHKNIDLGVSNIQATSVAYSNGYIYVVSNNFSNNEDGYLTKLDAISGDMIWQKSMGNSVSGGAEPLSISNGCVAADTDGNIIVGWNYISGNSRWIDFLIVKFDIHGDIQWQRSIGTAGADSTSLEKSSEFLTTDSTHVYVALQSNGDGTGIGYAGAIQIALDGTGAGSYGDWWYSNQQWSVYTSDITAGSSDITTHLISTPYTVNPSVEQNLTNVLTTLDTNINLIGGGITTGNLTFVESTMRGPASPINNYKVRIQPTLSFVNTLAVYPTGDNDIHLFEDSDLGGGITLGDYGKSNISVWGNGGSSTTVDDIALSTINDGTITLKTSTNDNNYEWVFDKTGSLVPSEKTVQGHTAFQTITSPTLVLGVNNNYTTITQAPYDETNTGGQNIRIQGQRGYGTYSTSGDGGWGGHIQIFGGLGGETNDRSTHSGGEGGYIEIQSGDGQHGRNGGYLFLQAGDARMSDGSTNNVHGGNVDINAGSAVDSIGANLGTGGNVNISAGQGNAAGQSGRIQIMTVGGNWQFTQTGEFKNNNSYTKTLETDLQGESVTQVVWTSTQNWVSGAKLLIQVETNEIGDTSGWHSQVCEAIIASRGYANGNNGVGDPVMTVYGVTHTSVDPLVTFTVQRNATTKNIEVVATRTAAVALSSSANLRVYSVETVTRD